MYFSPFLYRPIIVYFRVKEQVWSISVKVLSTVRSIHFTLCIYKCIVRIECMVVISL